MSLMQRQQQILDLVRERHFVTVQFLCRTLYASSATIRRDLAELEEKSLLTRVRGGAVLLEGANRDKPLLMRATLNQEKKEKIAALALRFVSDAATIFLDSSSTATALAARLGPYRDLSVMASGITCINALNELPTVKIFDCGGIVRNHSSLVGSLTLSAIERFRADLFFFSCCGFSLASGTTEANEENADVKRAMCRNAQKRILLCDSTKFGQEFFCKGCSLEEITCIVTDHKPPEPFLQALGDKLIYPE